MRSLEPPQAKWGLDEPLTPLMGGHRNAIYRCSGKRPELVFKSTLHTEESLRWQDDVQQIARSVGLEVPQMMKSRAGRFVEEGWTLESFVEGDPIEASHLQHLADPIAMFARHSCSLPQRPGFRASFELLDCAKGWEIDLTAMPGSLVRKCRDAWQAVSNEPHSIVHGDLNPTNILRMSDGRFALLDWDECRRDHCLFDWVQLSPTTSTERRAATAWEIACSWFREPQYARELAAHF